MSPEGDHAKHWVLVVDQDRCTGCWTCAVACKQLHNEPNGVWWLRVLTTAPDRVPDAPDGQGTTGGLDMDQPEGEYPDLRMTYLPMQCQHCEDPPCLKTCPVEAVFRRDDGIVLVDYERCIGCGTCIVECPYGARVSNWGRPEYPPGSPSGTSTAYRTDGRLVYTLERPPGVAESCILCVDRLPKDLQPCCVEICPVGARAFGDLNDPAGEVRRLINEGGAAPVMAELGTKPRIYYRPPRKRDISTPADRHVQWEEQGRPVTTP